MTRILSGTVLIGIAVVVVWFALPWVFLAVAELLLVLACVEYARLARASGLDVPAVASTVAAATTLLGMSSERSVVLASALMISFLGPVLLTLANWRGEADAVARAAAAVFPALYLGIPIGAMVSIRTRGPEVLFLMMLTVFVSDTGQYYTGRLFGRMPLAPTISPKKTAEGATGGFVCGALVMAIVGHWWLPGFAVAFRALLGVAIVALGIAGDLFESMLKRSAGVKDSSSLIPGHGGVLDRIDALLFAAPVYYVVVS